MDSWNQGTYIIGAEGHYLTHDAFLLLSYVPLSQCRRISYRCPFYGIKPLHDPPWIVLFFISTRSYKSSFLKLYYLTVSICLKTSDMKTDYREDKNLYRNPLGIQKQAAWKYEGVNATINQHKCPIPSLSQLFALFFLFLLKVSEKQAK